jgi:hypothetical protein
MGINEEIYIYNDENRIPLNWYADTTRFHLAYIVAPTVRPGCNLFSALLEYKYFPPSTPKNKQYHVAMVRWKDCIHSIISIPKEYENHAKAVAKLSGLRIANGIPTLRSDKKVYYFPIEFDNLFTLENEKDHPLYRVVGFAEAFKAVERQMVNIITHGGVDKIIHELRTLK